MNIAFANESFPPQYDGVAICMENYARIINEKYGKSYVITPAHEQRVTQDYPYHILEYPASKMKIADQYTIGLPLSLKLQKEFNKIPVDLLHSHSPFTAGLLAKRIAEKRALPHVATFHSKYKDDVNLRMKYNFEMPGELVARYVSAFYEKCDYVWTVNHGTAETLKEYGYKGDITIMPNGCDMPVTYRDDKTRRKIAEKYRLDAQNPILLFVGRLTYIKNIDTIVKALGAVKRHGGEFTMLFVGSGEDEKRLSELIREQYLEDHITLAGKVVDRDALRDIYSSCDLFLFPSMYDNAPLVVREAAACGCASLLIRGSNSAEGIQNRKNGILSENDVADIALAINHAIKDCNLKRLGENARKTIYIPWETVMEKAVAEYAKILADWKKHKHIGSKNDISLSCVDFLNELNINKPSKFASR